MTQPIRSVVAMIFVHSVPASIDFYGKLGLQVGNSFTPDVAAKHAELQAAGIEVSEITFPFYNPRGEFRLSDPDGYGLFIAPTRLHHFFFAAASIIALISGLSLASSRRLFLSRFTSAPASINVFTTSL